MSSTLSVELRRRIERRFNLGIRKITFDSRPVVLPPKMFTLSERSESKCSGGGSQLEPTMVVSEVEPSIIFSDAQEASLLLDQLNQLFSHLDTINYASFSAGQRTTEP